MSAFVPERGDLVWLDFSPQAGREQSARWPALVLSPRIYNAKVGLALMCPVTSKVKGYPFEVELPASGKIRGAVLSDHVKSLDWRARRARRGERAPQAVVEDVLGRLGTLLNLS